MRERTWAILGVRFESIEGRNVGGQIGWAGWLSELGAGVVRLDWI